MNRIEKRSLLLVIIAGLLVVTRCAWGADPIRPNPTLTPGATVSDLRRQEDLLQAQIDSAPDTLMAISLTNQYEALDAKISEVLRRQAHLAFSVDQFIAVVLEYQSPRALVGADTYGPTAKEFQCERSAEAAVSQSDDLLPRGHTLVTTCLRVKFGGPLPKGAVGVLPAVKGTFEYVTIAVEYGRDGGFIGAETLHIAPDRPTCLKEAHDVVDSNYREGHIEPGNSLLLYCLPVPAVEEGSSREDGGIV